jgi:RimJ/RimL family protein N-acetyltransferase
MDKFPELNTDRLVLKEVSFKDIPKIIEYAGNKKVADTTLNIPHPYEEKDAIFWINTAMQGFRNKTQFTFGIRLESTSDFIGGIGLKVNSRFNHAEVGYWIAETFWNKGYATEAVKAILQFGFQDLNLHKIYAKHLLENPASGKVMIKNGMIKEGELKDHTKKGDSYRSLIQYRLTQIEFKNIN